MRSSRQGQCTTHPVLATILKNMYPVIGEQREIMDHLHEIIGQDDAQGLRAFLDAMFVQYPAIMAAIDFAAEEGKNACLNVLLQRFNGANIRKNAFISAARYGNPGGLELLLDGVNPSTKVQGFKLALSNGHSNCVAFLIVNCLSKPYIRRNFHSAFQEMLHDDIPLHVRNAMKCVLDAVREKNVAVANALLDFADKNADDIRVWIHEQLGNEQHDKDANKKEYETNPDTNCEGSCESDNIQNLIEKASRK